MTFKEAIKTAYLEKYATFSGRASRSEYWWTYLAYILLVICSTILFAVVTGIYSELRTGTKIVPVSIKTFVFYIFMLIALTIPLISVQTRRFHDVNMSGWWLFLAYSFLITPFIVANNFDANNFSINLLGKTTQELLRTILIYIVRAGLYMIIFSAIFVFVITLLKGTNGPNRFGLDPLKPIVAPKVFV